MLQKVCENCVRIFERIEATSAPYVRYLVNKVKKETGILIDKPKREKPKTVLTPENIAAVTESVHEAPININSPAFSTIKHFEDNIETNLA